MKQLSLILCILLVCAPICRINAAPLFAPTATAVSITVPNVGTSAIQLIGAVTSGTLAYQTVLSGCGGCTNVTHGALASFNASTGVILYTPSSGFTGTDTFGFKVSDGSTTSSEALVTITVSSTRTIVTGPLIKPDGTNYTGTIYFQLTERASVTAGLMPTQQAVTATLSSGTFSVSLYPSTTLYSGAGKKVYYQVWIRTTYGQEALGVYDIPASSSSISLTSLSAVSSASGTNMQFVSQAAFNAFLGRANGLNVSNNGATVTGSPFQTLNFVPGANVSISTVDNGSGEIGITISDPTGGSGGTVGSATSGQVAVYNGATSVTGKAFAGATRIYKTNATNNGTEWDTLTAGTGISITNGVGDITIATTALTSLNALTGATQGFASSGGTCGSSFSIASSGSTHTFCSPSASATATGDVTASATQQVIAGEKLFTGFDNTDTPLTVKQKSSGSDTLQTWQDAGSVTVGEHSRYGVWHRTLNVGVSEGTPISFLNNGYQAKFYQTSVSDCASSPCLGLRVSTGYVGGTTSGTLSAVTGAVDLGETSGLLTDGNHASILATTSHTGAGTVTALSSFRAVFSNSTGSTGTAYGYKYEPSVAGGTVTNLFGFYGVAPSVTAGTLTNAYGLYLESLTAASSLNFAIYTNAGQVSLGDALTIRGMSAPAVSASDTGKLYYDSTADLLKLSLNGGSYANVGSYLEGTATLDFPSISANTCATALTITVTGAAADKPVWLGVPGASVLSGVVFTARVSGSNTVSVDACNVTGSAKDPASGLFTARVSQ